MKKIKLNTNLFRVKKKREVNSSRFSMELELFLLSDHEQLP
jgi:hypothetical protein